MLDLQFGGRVLTIWSLKMVTEQGRLHSSFSKHKAADQFLEAGGSANKLKHVLLSRRSLTEVAKKWLVRVAFSSQLCIGSYLE